MGNYAVLVVGEDQLGFIKNDPKFGEKVAQAVDTFSRKRENVVIDCPPGYGSAVVISLEHYSTAQIIEVSPEKRGLITKVVKDPKTT